MTLFRSRKDYQAFQRCFALTQEAVPSVRDKPQTAAEEAAVRDAISLSRPYGDDAWLDDFKKKLGRREPLPRGWPRKQRKAR